ncbi:MAG: hypothetical protein M0R49_09150 [Limnochordia bacterium]|nr:hypothetical protein [Limnochordia bacterium]
MSRKLDAAIAEMLGYEVFYSFRDWQNKGMPHIAKWVEYPAYWHKKFELVTCVPYYSTDGNAMLELDREMRERGYCLTVYLTKKTHEDYVAAYEKDGKKMVVAITKAMPEAVALVAYRALTGKDWKESEG